MNSRNLPILMYHSVGRLEEDPNLLCTSPERFEAQMRHLERRNLRGVTMRELHRATGAGCARGLVGLTFDDGYEDFLHTAVPIMERYGFSATVFAIGGMLGRENDWAHAYEPKPALRLLDGEGLREAAERGMEVGSHTMTHPSLDGLDPESLEQEVNESRRVLAEVLGVAVEGFCYPYGRLNGAAVRAVRGARYSYACSVGKQVEGSSYDLLRIPVMGDEDGRFGFAAKLRFFSRARSAKRGVYARCSKVSRALRRSPTKGA